MSLQTAKAKREERKTIVDEMGKLLPADGSAATPENLAKWQELDAKQEVLRTEIDAIEKQDTLDKEMTARLERRASATGKSPEQLKEEDDEYRAAFGSWMRAGFNGLDPEQRQIIAGLRPNLSAREVASIRNALSGVDVGQGGVLVPTGFYDKIESAEKAYGGMIDPDVAFNFKTDTGNELPVPTDNDTSNSGRYLGENKTVTDTDPKFGAVKLNAYVCSSDEVKVPFALLEDSAFDLESFLANKFGERIGRRSNTAFTVGTGASQPSGVITTATLGKTGAAQTTISYSEIIATKHSVDPAYRKGARWMMHDSTLQAIKTLTDGMGRPLWTSGLASKSPDTIDGDPFSINQDMDALGASKKPLAYGNFKKYFIRRVKDIIMIQLRERYADEFQVGFIAYERHDGVLVDAGTHPVKYFQNAA